MNYAFIKDFLLLRKDVKAIRTDVAAIKAMIEQQEIDRPAIDAAVRRLKESGDALDAKVKANPAPAP